MTGRAASRVFAVIIAMAGCGGGGTGPNGPGTAVMSKASPSGDGQSGPISTVLPDLLRVRILDGGAPVSGRTVSWQIQAPGGSLSPASSVTGADGVAATTVTLQPFGAGNVVTATSVGVNG